MKSLYPTLPADEGTKFVDEEMTAKGPVIGTTAGEYAARPAALAAPAAVPVYPMATPQQTRTRHFLLSPFNLRTYILFFYFGCLQYAMCLFGFCWVLTSALTCLLCCIACCIGLPFFCLFSYTWRALSLLQVYITKIFCPPEDPTCTVLMKPIAIKPEGVASFFSTNLKHTGTWRSIAYWCLIQFIWANFTFHLTVGILYLAVMFGVTPFMFMAHGYSMSNCHGCMWLISTPWACLLNVPIAIILFWIACMGVHLLARAERNIAWIVLGEKIVDSTHYSEMKIQREEGTAGTALLSKQQQQTGEVPIVICLPDDETVKGDYTKHTVTNDTVDIAVRKGRKGICISMACIICCLGVTAGLMVSAVLSLTSIRCDTASRITNPVHHWYDLANATEGETLGINVDFGQAFYGTDILIYTSSSTTSVVHYDIYYEYLPMSDGATWEDYFTATQKAGVVDLASSRIGFWTMIWLCAKVRIIVTVPENPSTTKKFNFLVTGSDTSLDIDAGTMSTVAWSPFSTVRFETSNGHINVEKLGTVKKPIGGALYLHSSDGRIDGESLVSQTSLTVDSSDGRLNFDEISSPSTNLKTSNGRIDIDTTHLVGDGASCSLKTSNGRVDLDKVLFTNNKGQSLTVESENGRVDLTANGYEGNFDLETDNGSIDFDSETTAHFTTDDSDEKTGYIGTLGDNPNMIEVTSDNGRIDFEQEKTD